MFNEHCNTMGDSEAQATLLRSELSELGELLTDRFQLEDQLIEFVHNPAARIPTSNGCSAGRQLRSEWTGINGRRSRL